MKAHHNRKGWALIDKQDNLDAFITELSNELKNNGVEVVVVKEGNTLNVYTGRKGLMQWKGVLHYPDECCYLHYQVNQEYEYVGHVSTIPFVVLVLSSFAPIINQGDDSHEHTDVQPIQGR